MFIAIWGYSRGLFTNRANLEKFLRDTGALGPIIFIIIQIVQCVIPIIPGGISLLIGVIVFGPIHGFIYNYVGIIIGSCLCFFLARYYGKAFVQAVASEKTYSKYIQWLDRNQKKFNYFFAFAMLAPGMPDDLICNIAGLSKMSFRYFFITLLIMKIPTILMYTFFLDHAFEGIQSIWNNIFK